MSLRDPAREAILARVRSGLHGTSKTPKESIPRAYARTRPMNDLVTVFCERVADYRATVHQCPSGQAAEAIATILREANASRVLTPSGLPAPWLQALLPPFEQVDDTVAVDELDRVDAVVTTAAVGISSTGTIVLDHGPGQGRRAATLVPDMHICVVDRWQIVDDLPSALGRLRPDGPLTFISGPSATSDIELDRVEGVHGPRTLHVVVTTG